MADDVSRALSIVLSRISAEIGLLEPETILIKLPQLRTADRARAAEIIVSVFEAHGAHVLELWLRREGWTVTAAQDLAVALEATKQCVHCRDWPENRVVGDLAGIGQDPHPAVCPDCGRVRRTVRVTYEDGPRVFPA